MLWFKLIYISIRDPDWLTENWVLRYSRASSTVLHWKLWFKGHEDITHPKYDTCDMKYFQPFGRIKMTAIYAFKGVLIPVWAKFKFFFSFFFFFFLQSPVAVKDRVLTPFLAKFKLCWVTAHKSRTEIFQRLKVYLAEFFWTRLKRDEMHDSHADLAAHQNQQSWS